MSAELERVFSSAKLLTTSHRNLLKADIIEVLELHRHWWFRNIIDQIQGGGGRLSILANGQIR
jgi:hypothetical protein